MGKKIKPKIEKRDKTTGKGNDVIYRKTIEGKKSMKPKVGFLRSRMLITL